MESVDKIAFFHFVELPLLYRKVQTLMHDKILLIFLNHMCVLHPIILLFLPHLLLQYIRLPQSLPIET